MTLEPQERNPFVSIGVLVVVLAAAAGLAARFGLNDVVTAVCVVVAILGTWLLLSPQTEVIESTLPAAGVAVAEAPPRQNLRSTPRVAVGFDKGAGARHAGTPPARLPALTHDPLRDDDDDGVAPVRALGRLPQDAVALQVDTQVEPDGMISGAFTLGRFEVRAASRRGSDNVILDDPRQDDYVVAGAANGRYLVIVVADGEGSAEHARYGAHWTCRLLARAIDRHLRDGVPGIENMLDRTREDIGQLFEETFPAGTRMRTIATKLVGLIAPVESGPAAGFRVGDGDILVAHDDGWRSVFVTPAPDPDIVFPRSIAADVAALELDGRCLLLSSDGVSKPIAANPSVAATLHRGLRRPVSEVEFDQLLTFPLEEARGDRTAVGVWFNPAIR